MISTRKISQGENRMQSLEWDMLSPIENGSVMDIDSSVDSLKSPSPRATHRPHSQLPSGLQKALRKHVHDNMPIRLLAFQPDGSGIELLERNTVLHRIFQAMETEIDQDVFHDNVDHKVLESPGKRRVSRQEAEKAVITALVRKYTRYAILSHTWARNGIGEMEYKDWTAGTRKDGAYRKLEMFCEVAARHHNVTYGWMDSVCINKESSSELDESIRSMYQWYRDAHICITILADTTSIGDMRYDDWFKRGWTLQELLAPARVKFYAKDWSPLTEVDNDKQDARIKEELEAATHITPYELKCFTLGSENLSDNTIPISRRMLWAANREVTRGEDTAYSLMGIFGVSISIAYGEGAERAFFRLVKKILNSFAEVWDVFNCAGPQPDLHTYRSRVIPSSPKHYLQRSTAFSDMDYGISNTPREPITLTHLGLRVRLLCIAAVESSAAPSIPFGQYSGVVSVGFQDPSSPTCTYNLLDRDAFYTSVWDRRRSGNITVAFGVLNFVEDNDTISVSGNCLAFGFWFYQALGGQLASSKGRKQVMKTDEPIVFKLAYNYEYSDHMSSIDKKDLKKEGMELISLYL
ncbi:heterokaryon incompatibility protein-domain-containing protein [Pholiota molesta]|nr:heterokaryon incompatibility protein-domain-containing protein [Pholiota molesta]